MLQQDFNTALKLTQDEQYLDAIKIYEKILQTEPGHAPTHYNLGLLAAKTGDVKKARVHFEQLVRLTPDFPPGHFQLAQMLLFEDQPLDAIAQLKIAIELQVDYTNARHLLACTAMQQQQEALANEHFEYLLLHEPNNANVKLNFSLLKLYQRKLDEAKQLLDTALAIDPSLTEAHYHRGVIAMQQGDVDRAILEMQETLDRQAHHFAANYNLGILYKMQHHYKLAIHYLKKAQELQPDNQSIQFLLAAFEQQQTPKSAPQSFVQELFNHYAPTYDQHMEEVLHYNTPKQLRDLLNTQINHLKKNPMILDLGCGTGLVGKYFHDLNANFTGIDLSDEMLALAKEKNIYSQLEQADILSYLKNTQQKFDLVIASDVFNYFGILDDLFAACNQALNPGGLILFSIELADQQEYLLHTSARFAHSAHYITELADAEHWQLLAEHTHTLRLQENKPVIGKVFLYHA